MTGPTGMRGSRRALAPMLSALAAVLVAVITLGGCATAPHHGAGGAPLTSAPGTGGAAPVGLGPSGSPSTSAAAAVQTTMKEFAPLDATGRVTTAAHRGGDGSCFATSIAVPLAGVYRCLSGNTILDPCFAPARETTPATVVCYADPWSAGTVLTLAGGLPRYAPDLTEGNPWAIELGTGARCIAITGTVTSVGNIDLTYSCDDGSSAGLTVDTDGVMSAHYGQPDGPLQQTGVVVAWRGRSYRFAG